MEGLLITFKYEGIKGFLGGPAVKNLPANAEDTCVIPGAGRSPGERNGKSPGLRSLTGYGPQGHKRVRHDLETKLSTNMKGLEYMKTLQSVYACRRQQMEKEEDFKTGEKEREGENEGVVLIPCSVLVSEFTGGAANISATKTHRSGRKGS